MEAIINFLTGIGDGLLAIVDFLGGMIEDILYVVQLTGSFVLKIPDFFDWLPPELIAIVVSLFAVVVVYKILGREG